MGFKVHIDEEYGYREYVVIINGMTIEQFKTFVLGEDIEDFFFHSGGLIVGSTNNLDHKSTSVGKTVDFYSGLKLDGPINPDSKNYE